MRLYRTASGGWVGTQAEAKAGGRGWEMVDVPMLKESLLVWLNINARPKPDEDEPSNMTDEEVRQSNTPEAQREAAVRMSPSSVDTHAAYKQAERQTQFKTDEIVDFIFDEASVNQVSQIHGAIGTRFAEELKKGRLTGLLD